MHCSVYKYQATKNSLHFDIVMEKIKNNLKLMHFSNCESGGQNDGSSYMKSIL